LIVSHVRDNLRCEVLNALGQRVASVKQFCEDPPCCFWKRLTRVDERFELAELADPFRTGQAEFGGQATRGICQHRLLPDQQGSG
jgi:hypothetical protein